MSCASVTTASLCRWTAGTLDLIDYMLSVGWRVYEPRFLYRPWIEDEDDVEWESARVGEFTTVRRLIARQQEANLTSGVQLERISEEGSAFFTIRPSKHEIRVDWGAECPRHPQWPRVVDPSWATTRVAEALGPARNLVCDLNFWADGVA